MERWAELLGEIIESGLYTKYLPEVWLSYRAHLQLDLGASSFSFIANRYFDRLRVKCLNTLLRHYTETGDEKTLVLMENLVACEILHRQILYGNESMVECANLHHHYFIHPRMQEED